VYAIQKLDPNEATTLAKEAEAMKAKLPRHKTFSTSAKTLALYAVMENTLNFVFPPCTALDRPERDVPVAKSTNIIDLSGVGLKQLWLLKDHIQDASVLANTHCPEILDRTFVVWAPSFFPMVWGWIKRWFDPDMVAKMHILSRSEARGSLEAFVDLDDIPKLYGGNLDWEYPSPPSMDAAVKAHVESDGFPGWTEGPCRWMGGRRIPVGTVKGIARRPSI